MPRDRHGFPNEFARQRRRFVPEQRTDPRAGPSVLHVLRSRPGLHPERIAGLRQQYHAASGRHELRRAGFLAVVMAIRERQCRGIGTIRQPPVLRCGDCVHEEWNGGSAMPPRLRLTFDDHLVGGPTPAAPFPGRIVAMAARPGCVRAAEPLPVPSGMFDDVHDDLLVVCHGRPPSFCPFAASLSRACGGLVLSSPQPRRLGVSPIPGLLIGIWPTCPACGDRSRHVERARRRLGDELPVRFRVDLAAANSDAAAVSPRQRDQIRRQLAAPGPRDGPQVCPLAVR